MKKEIKIINVYSEDRQREISNFILAFKKFIESDSSEINNPLRNEMYVKLNNMFIDREGITIDDYVHLRLLEALCKDQSDSLLVSNNQLINGDILVYQEEFIKKRIVNNFNYILYEFIYNNFIPLKNHQKSMFNIFKKKPQLIKVNQGVLRIIDYSFDALHTSYNNDDASGLGSSLYFSSDRLRGMLKQRIGTIRTELKTNPSSSILFNQCRQIRVDSARLENQLKNDGPSKRISSFGF